MPRIPNTLLDCVFYLYSSEEAAKEGTAEGATGFFVSVPMSLPGWSYLYMVTNRHCLPVPGSGGSLWARINTADGKFDIIKLANDNWVRHPYGDDVAIYDNEAMDFQEYKFNAVPCHLLLTQSVAEHLLIGPGDDVFMVGRFIDHEGRQQNLPSVRFGNISMMPLEPIPTPSGLKQESYIVEMRSISGFSGSPVFVHWPESFQPRLPNPFDPINAAFDTNIVNTWCIGIDWGHLQRKELVREDVTSQPIEEKYYVNANTGMATVVPSWKIWALIYLTQWVRKEAEIDNLR